VGVPVGAEGARVGCAVGGGAVGRCGAARTRALASHNTLYSSILSTASVHRPGLERFLASMFSSFRFVVLL
jgi:hypothetical protein